jgi:serine/threonine protein phosphatase 1
MKKLYVIGDVHGCLFELKEVLARTDSMIKEDDEYVFLGDYIDRGPDSKGVIDLLIERSKTHPIKHTFITGNHEEMMLEEEHYWAINGGIETLKSYGIEPDDDRSRKYLEHIPEDHLRFLLGLKEHYKVGRTVCVHAGLNPSVCLTQQERDVKIWAREWVGYDGPYADGSLVVYGHTPKYDIIKRENQLGIDTACVFGGLLTCAIIEPEEGKLEAVVQSKSTFSWER